MFCFSSKLKSFAVLLICLSTPVINGCGLAQPAIPIYAAPELADINTVSRIVIARGRGITGSAYKFYITLDGTEIAALWPSQYTEVLVDPGTHSLGVKTYLPNIFGFGGYGAAVIWFGPGDWQLVSLNEEFKTGSEYRFFATYDIWNSKGKIEKVEYFPKYIKLDPEKMVPLGTIKTNPELLAP